MMYVPATPALTVTALPPIAITAGEPPRRPRPSRPADAPAHPELSPERSRRPRGVDRGLAAHRGPARREANGGREWADGHDDAAVRRASGGARACARHPPTARGTPGAGGGADGRPAGARAPRLAHDRRARTGAVGRFRLRYGPSHRQRALRVRFAGAPGEDGSERAVGRLNVYRLAEASWYGGEGSLACGGWLTSATLGVANKTLPCGTLVTLRYDGRTVRVPVIDRGPYVAGREFDLTEATKRALGFDGVGEVWATS